MALAERDHGPVELNHGTMFSRAIDEGLIVPERSVQIGIRTWVDDPLGITIIDNEAACETSPRSLATAIAAITRDHPVYITVDIDCARPGLRARHWYARHRGANAFAAAANTPQSAHAAHMWVRCRRGRAAVRCRWLTALNAATIIYEQLARLALGRGAVQKHYAALSGNALRADLAA